MYFWGDFSPSRWGEMESKDKSSFPLQNYWKNHVQSVLLMSKSVKFCEEMFCPSLCSTNLVRNGAHMFPERLTVSQASEKSDLSPAETAKKPSINFSINQTRNCFYQVLWYLKYWWVWRVFWNLAWQKRKKHNGNRKIPALSNPGTTGEQWAVMEAWKGSYWQKQNSECFTMHQ